MRLCVTAPNESTGRRYGTEWNWSRQNWSGSEGKGSLGTPYSRGTAGGNQAQAAAHFVIAALRLWYFTTEYRELNESRRVEWSSEVRVTTCQAAVGRICAKWGRAGGHADQRATPSTRRTNRIYAIPW